MSKKKKLIIKEMEALYAERFDDYREFMSHGEYEEAQKAFGDCKDILVQINAINSKRIITPAEIASIAASTAISGLDLVDSHYWRGKTFEFEEHGTIGSFVGKKMLTDAFQRTKPNKF